MFTGLCIPSALWSAAATGGRRIIRPQGDAAFPWARSTLHDIGQAKAASPGLLIKHRSPSAAALQKERLDTFSNPLLRCEGVENVNRFVYLR